MNLDFESSLNDKQKEAVFSSEGPMLILAGAGSGKTRVLTYKIARLVNEGLASPGEILAVTFTNKAAKEMQDRIASMIPGTRFPFVNTFHSFCVKVLRSETPEDYSKNFVIYDESDKTSLIKTVMKELKADTDRYPPSKISSVISKLKNRMKGPDDLNRRVEEWDLIARIYENYDKAMKSNNAMDFDDLLINAYRAFKNDYVYADSLRRHLKYILIDEYQDINLIQYMLMREICRNNDNITVVGDDDQSIYRFRGADMSIILKFEDDYPHAHVVKLEQNYRSTSTILDAANALMLHNKNRKQKKLWTAGAKGEKIRLSSLPNGGAEARFAVRKIKELIKGGSFTYKDFVIIYRTNAQSRLFEEAMMQEGVPYRLVGANDFYKRAEIKDLTAYLKLIENPDDDVSFRRIVNVPPRGIGEIAEGRIEDAAREKSISLFEACRIMASSDLMSARQKNSLSCFVDMIDSAREKSVSENAFDVLSYIAEASDYRGYLQSPSKSASSAEGVAREENMNEFLNVAKEFCEGEESARLSEFLAQLALISDLDSMNSEEGKVSLMTFHLTKGLEFPVVFITGLEEKLLPHFMSINEPDGIEEERRLFYVGITRAKQLLFMTYASSRMEKGISESKTPSRFIHEIPTSFVIRTSESQVKGPTAFAAIKRKAPLYSAGKNFEATGESKTHETLQKGDIVLHKLFGKGIILSCSGGQAKVDFLKNGQKNIVVTFLSKA